MVEGEQSRGRGGGDSKELERSREFLPKSVLYLCHVLRRKVDDTGI